MNKAQARPGCTGRWWMTLLLAAASACSPGSVASAANLTFVVSNTTGVTNSEVVVPVQARQFASVSSFQFSLHWNTNIATYVGVERFGLPGLTNNNESFGTPFTAAGTLTVAWFDPQGSAQSVPDNTTIFGVRLKLVGPAASSFPVAIDSVPTAIEAGNDQLEVLPVSIVNGVLSIDHTLLYLCPNQKSAECGTQWSFDTPAIFDSCSGTTNGVTINVLSTSTNVSGTCGYTATRTWEIIDQCSNRATCSQTVTVVDTTPPTASCVDKTIELGTAWAFDAPSATDACTPAASLAVRVVSTTTNNSGSCGFAFVATRIWEILDGCSNAVTCSQVVTVRDTTAPYLTCPPGKNVNCRAAWAFDAPGAVDLASGTVITPVVVGTVTNGSCGNAFSATRTWRATDACGNSSTCTQTVFGQALVDVSGTLYLPTNYPAALTDKRVPGAIVTGPSNSVTALDGTFRNTFESTNNVTVVPLAPVGNPADGVTTFDISQIRRHILTVTSLDNPYRWLAADVDGSGTISTLDLSYMRRLILGVTNRFPLGLWRFVPASHTFANPLAPWNPPTNRSYANVISDLAGQDFLAIKLGDVNASWSPSGDGGSVNSGSGSTNDSGRSGALDATGNPVVFTVGSTNSLPGNEVTVPITVSGFSNIVGFQFSIHWDPSVVALIGLEQFGIPFNGSMYNLAMSNSGIATVAWNDETGGTTTIADGSAVFVMRFQCIGSATSATSIQMDGLPTAFEVATQDQVVPSSAASGSVLLNQPNRAPILANLSNRVVDELAPLSFTANVSDLDGGQIYTFSLDPGAPTGAEIDGTTGVFSWTPTEAQGPGVYTVTIRVTDNGVPAPLADSKSFTIQVNEINTPPQSAPDDYTTDEDVSLHPSAPGVLANDIDADGDTLRALLVSTTTNGTLVLLTNGDFTYAPNANFNGNDGFTYLVTDGVTISDPATVTIHVNPVNDAPRAAADAYVVDEDSVLTVDAPGVLLNDSDPENTMATAILVNGPAHGTLTLNANGSFTYQPNADYDGPDEFSYRASDGQVASSATAVSLTVLARNDPPTVASIPPKRQLRGNLLRFTITAADVDEPKQKLTFSLDEAPTGAVIDPSSGVFTWTADGPAPATNWVRVRVSDDGSPAQSTTAVFPIVVDQTAHVTVDDVTVPGGTDGTLQAVFEVTLSAPCSQAISVDYTTVDQSAVAGIDYTPSAGRVIFAPGVTNQTIDVTVVGSSAIHSNRIFSVRLSNPTNAVIDRDEAVAVITAEPATGLSMNDVVVSETTGSSADAVFNVTLWPPSERLVTVRYITYKGSAMPGKDFKPKRGVLKFLPGQTSASIVVPITGDSLSESNEFFYVNLSKPVNSVVATPWAKGFIVDDDALPSLSITDRTVIEGNAGTRSMSFTVQLSAKSGRTVTCDFTTVDGTGTAGSDFNTTAGTLVFPPGLTRRVILVPIRGDTLGEGTEIFSLQLTTPVNAEIADGDAVGTIRDNDVNAANASGIRKQPAELKALPRSSSPQEF